MLQAEVLSTLKTISQHLSYTSNEGITDLFKIMFPDSDIASTFLRGINKTAYITKFGLARFITKELTEQVNQAAGFVPCLMKASTKPTKPNGWTSMCVIGPVTAFDQGTLVCSSWAMPRRWTF